MKRVCLFTTFFEVESGYSLVTVATTQIEMLLEHGYDVRVLVQGGFQGADSAPTWRPEVVDLRLVVPDFELVDGIHEDFDARVELVLSTLREHLKDVDVCITHDVFLQNSYKEHNVAVRLYSLERPDLLWLNWIHSRPTAAEHTTENLWATPEYCRQSPVPGYVVYPNNVDRNVVAVSYDMLLSRVKVCRAGHAIDPMSLLDYHELTLDLVEKSDLLGGDLAMVYPVRMDRGKQLEKIVRLMAGLNLAQHEPRLLVLDWQSSGEHFQKYEDELLALAAELGVGNCLHFASRLNQACVPGTPRRVVIELMTLTNVYVHSSAVETYSLTAHEAMLFGNLCVLNHDWFPMRELFGDGAIYMDFGSVNQARTYYPDEQGFWNEEAKRLLAEFYQNRVLVAKTKAQREWNPKRLWRTMEPLLYLEAV